MAKRRVIIDTDLGIDDAHAVLLALKADDLHIEGFTTVFGNAQVVFCTRNLLYFLEMVERPDLPVYQGTAAPLFKNLWDPANSQRVHGPQGIGELIDVETSLQPASGNAIQWLVDTVLENPGEIEVLALGPLSNIALAILIEPTWAAKVKRLVFMGGATYGPGNVRPLSTANIFNDAEAAKIVFHAGFSSGIVMVGQDVTREARLNSNHRVRLRNSPNVEARFLDTITEFYEDFYSTGDARVAREGVPIHDLLVPAHLLWPHLYETEKLYVTVESEGDITRGLTVADRRSFSPETPQMTVCTGIHDYDELFDRYLGIVT